MLKCFLPSQQLLLSYCMHELCSWPQQTSLPICHAPRRRRRIIFCQFLERAEANMPAKFGCLHSKNAKITGYFSICHAPKEAEKLFLGDRQRRTLVTQPSNFQASSSKTVGDINFCGLPRPLWAQIYLPQLISLGLSTRVYMQNFKSLVSIVFKIQHNLKNHYIFRSDLPRPQWAQT